MQKGIILKFDGSFYDFEAAIVFFINRAQLNLWNNSVKEFIL